MPHILLVEDEAITGIFKTKQLRSYGYSVTHVMSGEAAIEYIRNNTYDVDLVLMDIDLGQGIDGAKAAQQILSYIDIPLVFLSSHAEPEIVEKTEKITSYGYVLKSSSITVLDASIKMAFKLHNAYLKEIQNEKALKASELKYRNLFEFAPVGIFQSTIDGKIILANNEMAHLLGFNNPDEVIAYYTDVSSQLYVHPEERHRFIEYLEEKGAVENFGCFAYTRDKRKRWFLINARMSKNSGLIEGFFYDITDNKLMEDLMKSRLRISNLSYTHCAVDIMKYTLREAEKLTESEVSFLHFINENHQNISLQVWSDSTEKVCNVKGLKKHYDISEAGVWLECFYDKQPVIHNIFKNTQRKGQPEGHVSIDRELIVPVLRDGRVQALLGVGNKNIDYSQLDVKIVNTLADICWDIVSLKQVEEALQESEKKYRHSFKNANSGICLVDFEGKILDTNDKMSEIFGYSKNDFEHMNILEVTHPEDVNLFLNFFKEAKKGITEKNDLETRYIHKSGYDIFARVSSSLIGENEESKNCFIVHIMDITERKKSENEILKLNQYILDVQEDERQRIARDLHDSVGQTLNAIKLNVEMYLNDNNYFSDRLGLALQFIDNANKEIRGICSDLFPAILSDMGLPAAIRWYSKNVLETKNIQVELDINLTKEIKRDLEVNLYRIIQEIFSNIIKHSKAEKVNLQLYNDKDIIFLSVKDDGIGISKDSESSKESFGLKNIEHRVKSINGSYSIKSKNDFGTCISIKIDEAADGCN